MLRTYERAGEAGPAPLCQEIVNATGLWRVEQGLLILTVKGLGELGRGQQHPQWLTSAVSMYF